MAFLTVYVGKHFKIHTHEKTLPALAVIQKERSATCLYKVLVALTNKNTSKTIAKELKMAAFRGESNA